MLIVNSALKRDYIIGLLDHQTIDGAFFTHVKTENMKIYFNVTGIDMPAAVKIAKNVIKKSELGSALFFMVDYEK
jgi:hypothetical protein